MEELRDDERLRGRRSSEESSRGNRRGREKQPERTNGLDYKTVIKESAQLMGVYDVNLIMSWEPWEYEALRLGAQHRIIDKYEFMANEAMANRTAQHVKRTSANKIFNAKQARRNLERGIEGTDKDIERMIDLNNKFKGFKPNFIPKGG